jgi:peptidoglycan/LPS O-acetylase OafA/YrhL
MEHNFFQELKHRLIKPWNTAFLGYFLLIVIVFGGFGVLYSCFEVAHSKEDDDILVAQNLATYFMAILASSIIDLNISWEIENRVSILIYSMLFFVVGLMILICTYSIENNYAFIPAVVGTALSWVVWILANADNERLSDENFYNNMRGKGKHGTHWANS